MALPASAFGASHALRSVLPCCPSLHRARACRGACARDRSALDRIGPDRAPLHGWSSRPEPINDNRQNDYDHCDHRPRKNLASASLHFKFRAGDIQVVEKTRELIYHNLPSPDRVSRRGLNCPLPDNPRGRTALLILGCPTENSERAGTASRSTHWMCNFLPGACAL